MDPRAQMHLGGAAAAQNNAGSLTPVHAAQLQVALWAVKSRVQGIADMLQSLQEAPAAAHAARPTGLADMSRQTTPSAANGAHPNGLADMQKPWPGSGPYHPGAGLGGQGPNYCSFEPMFAPALSATQLPNIGGSLVCQGRNSASTVRPDFDDCEDSQENTANTLRRHLQRVRQYPGRIVVVRGIAKLGFEAESLLEEHFCADGGVAEVLVAHSKIKSTCDRGRPYRKRPGNMGLIVMKSVEAQQQILAEGDQWVRGVRVAVTSFDHKAMAGSSEQAEAPGGKNGWGNEARSRGSMTIDTNERSINGEDTPPGDSLDGDSPGKKPHGSQRSTQDSSNNSDGGFTYSVTSGSVEEPQDVAPPAGLQHMLTQYHHLGLNNQVPPSTVAPPPGLVLPMRVDISEILRNMLHNPDAPENNDHWQNSDCRQQPPPPQQQRRESQGCKTVQLAQGTLCSQLTLLQQEDQTCVFITRHINKLGFRSREVLHRHYSRLTQGQVCRVLVAHSKSKPHYDSKDQLRTRPGGLGFVVMKNAAIVEQILALGEHQLIGSHKIVVRPFEKPKEKNNWTNQMMETYQSED